MNDRSKLFYLLIALMHIFLVTYCSDLRGGSNMHTGKASDLKIGISLNQNKYKAGDVFEMNITITNTSNKRVFILPRWQIYTVDYFNFILQQNSNPKKSPKILIEPQPFNRKDVIFLQAGEDYILSLKGNIFDGKFRSVMDGLMEGLFIDFDDSLMKIEENQPYRVWVMYSIKKGMLTREIWGKVDFWQGNISSNEAEFIVTN